MRQASCSDRPRGVGFPIALALAWVYELTPEGIALLGLKFTAQQKRDLVEYLKTL